MRNLRVAHAFFVRTKYAVTWSAEQGCHDVEPLFVEWFARGRFASAAIPVSGVPDVAFFAMQVGVNPGTVGTFVLLRGFVSAGPVALRVPPQAGESEREPGRLQR